MKGLVLKDIYGVKFQILGALAVMLFPALGLILLGGGMFVGDGEMAAGGVGSMIALLPIGIMNYVSITLCSSFLLNTLGYDEKSGWSKMQRTMPLTGGQIVGAKFCAMGLVLGMLTLMSLIVNLLVTVLFRMPPEPMIALPFVMCMLQIVALSPTFALGYRFGSRATSAVYIGFMVLTATAGIWLTFLIFGGDLSAAALRVICYAAIPVIAAAVAAASWAAGKKAVMFDI